MLVMPFGTIICAGDAEGVTGIPPASPVDDHDLVKIEVCDPAVTVKNSGVEVGFKGPISLEGETDFIVSKVMMGGTELVKDRDFKYGDKKVTFMTPVTNDVMITIAYSITGGSVDVFNPNPLEYGYRGPIHMISAEPSIIEVSSVKMGSRDVAFDVTNTNEITLKEPVCDNVTIKATYAKAYVVSTNPGITANETVVIDKFTGVLNLSCDGKPILLKSIMMGTEEYTDFTYDENGTLILNSPVTGNLFIDAITEEFDMSIVFWVIGTVVALLAAVGVVLIYLRR